MNTYKPASAGFLMYEDLEENSWIFQINPCYSIMYEYTTFYALVCSTSFF